MRILHVIHTLDPRRGGPVECVRQLGQYFSRAGHSFEVVAAADRIEDDWVGEFPVKVYPLGPAYGEYAYSPRVGTWLKKYARNHDVIFINGVWQAHTRTAARIARNLGIPYFVYAHGLLDPWNRSAHPLKYVKKFLYWAVAEKSTLQNANGVVFTSSEEARLAEHYFPVSGWKPIVAGNGIARPAPAPPPTEDPDAEHLFQRFPQIAGRRVWLYLGRIHPKKGLENLLQAFPYVSDDLEAPLLVIVGDGERRYIERLKQMSIELGKDKNIQWTGPLYGHEKWAAFRASEVFVLPSHQENFGIVVVESLALGIPVITTKAVNIWPSIEKSNSGIICDDTVESLGKALVRWSAMNSQSRKEMARNAVKCFEEQFEIGAAATRLLAAMREATGNHGTQRELVA